MLARTHIYRCGILTYPYIFPERTRLVHRWPLKTSHLNAASFHYLRNGPAFFFSFFSLISSSPFYFLVARSIVTSDQLSSAAPCRDEPRRAVRHWAVLCCAVPCCVLCSTYYFVHTRYHSKYHTRSWYYYSTPGCTYYLLNNKNSLPAQLSPAIAPQRSAVRCRVLLCRAVLCCAALRFLSNIQYQLSCKVPGTRYRYARVYLSFCFLLHLIVLFRSPSCFFFTNYTRTADQNVTSPTSAQHSKGQSALNK